jgi:hypothetical protein
MKHLATKAVPSRKVKSKIAHMPKHHIVKEYRESGGKV